MTLIDGSNTLLTQLAPSALRAIVLAGVAGLVLAAFRVKSSALRLSTWTVVLYAALAMPMLGWLLPSLPVPIPAALAVTNHVTLEPQGSQVIVPRIASSHGTTDRVGIQKRSAVIPVPQSNPHATQPFALPAAPFRPGMRWGAFAAAVYLAFAAFLLLRLVAGLILGGKMLRASHPIVDARLTSALISRGNAFQLSRTSRAAESELISVPVTMGVLRPVIMLPADWRLWDDATLDAVIAHEVSHVARRDSLTQCLALAHRAIFWFSPLSWWLYRHLADLAEQSSDEAALSSGADRNDYARTLLGFFEALRTSPGRVWWQGVSMAKAGQAEERVERILAWKKAGGAVTMSLKKSVSVAVIALAVPVVYVTASVRPASHSQAAVAAPQAQTATLPPPPAAVAPAAPAGHVAPAAAGEFPPPRPVVAAAPAAPVAPAAVSSGWAVQSKGVGRSHGGYSFAFGYDDEQRFVIVKGDSDSLTMSGSSEDAHHVERLRKHITGDFIWFQRDEKSYIIRDQATIDRARALWAPQEELGKKQEELGRLQEELGKQQEALGTRMEQVKVNVPDMTAELDKLKAKLQKLGPTATMDQIGDLQSEIGELQSKIGDIQSQAGEEQSKLGDEQGALGEKQGKLGEKQGELGEQQAKLAEEATRKMKSLLDEAIKNGKAQPEPDSGADGTL